jgi:hypothetical protein
LRLKNIINFEHRNFRQLIKQGVNMKNKNYSRFFALLILAGVLVFGFNQCKNVGPSEMPEPTPYVTSQLKLTVYDSDNGSILQGYSVKVIFPDGTTKDFTNENGTLNIDQTMEGNYIVTASKDGYLAENEIVEVEKVVEENISAVITQQDFYLNKKGNASLVTPQGTVITVASDLAQNTTIQFPYGAISNDQNVVVSFIQPPYKNGDLKVLGERVLINGYDFSPDLTFPQNLKPTINIPINVQSVLDGGKIFFGSFDAQTNSWESIEGTLNAERNVASFEMPHFSAWYTFTGYRLVKNGTSWAPWSFVSESEVCSAGACGTYIFTVAPSSLINELISLGYSINLKVKDTRCVGPHFQWAQQLYARCQLIDYSVYDYTGQLMGNIQVPTKKFQWMVDEWYCHDQGGGK